jgi:hypothetical protein
VGGHGYGVLVDVEDVGKDHPVVEDLPVGFVGKKEDTLSLFPAPAKDGCEVLKLLLAVNDPGGVVRGVDDDGLWSFSLCRVDLCDVE